MRLFLLILKLVAAAFLGYLAVVLAFWYEPGNPAFHPPFVLVVIDWIDLYIHEAGHLLFRPFGQFVYVLGGSLTQVLLPLLLAAVSLRQNPPTASLPLFWTGESMVNVSAYISDAAAQRLHLIGRGLIHDWHWLLDGDPDLASGIGTTVFLLGIAFCIAGIGTLVWFSIAAFRESAGD